MTAPTVRLSGPEDLIAVVPHLFGYAVTESILAIDLIPANPTRLGFMARIDLPAEGEATEVANTLTSAMLRHGQGIVCLIGYETVTGEALPGLVMTGDAMRAAGVNVFDQLIVTGDRWRSLGCSDTECCPTEGKPVPGADHPAALALIGPGSAPVKDRQTLADHIAASPRAATVMDVITDQRDEASTTPESAAAAWGAVLTSTDPLTDQTIAAAALGLTLGEGKQFRDTLLAWMTPGVLDLELTDPTCLTHLRALQPATPDTLTAPCEAVTDRLITLCASIPDSEATPALTVLAHYAWINGKGTIASLALDRALAAQPDYTLARLLDRMVSAGIRLR